MRGAVAAGLLGMAILLAAERAAAAQEGDAAQSVELACPDHAAPVEQHPDRKRSGQGGAPPARFVQVCGVAVPMPVGVRLAACQDPDGIQNGAIGANYADGTQYLAGSCDHGQAHGRWRRWHENGRLALDSEYRRGKRHGTWTFWSRNGKPVCETRLRRGELHGRQRTWHRNGVKAEESWYRHGKLRQRAKRWDERGQRIPEPPEFPAHPSSPSTSAEAKDERARSKRKPVLPSLSAQKKEAVFSIACTNRVERALALRRRAAADPNDLDLGAYLQAARWFLLCWCSQKRLSREALQCFMREKSVVELSFCAAWSVEVE